VNIPTRIIFLLVALFVQPLASAASPKYDNFFVFGDSLSDTGNDLVLTKSQKISPPIPPSEGRQKTYYKGRFSNGNVAVEYLWGLLRNEDKAPITLFLSKKDVDLKGAVNFAFGGSASGYLNQTPGQFYVPGLLGQVEMFQKALSRKIPKGRSLYMIWTGANDYLLGLTTQPEEVVANIARAVEILHALGARDVLIVNQPDLGQVPLVQNQPGVSPSDLSLLTVAHNELLSQTRDDLASRLDGAKITLVDIYTLTNDLLGNGEFVASPPALAVISPDTGAVDCLFRDPTTCSEVKLDSHTDRLLFWDVVHPTTSVHGRYGQAMFDSLPKQ
jgi:phospholipase/lecithinase/hemolysin